MARAALASIAVGVLVGAGAFLMQDGRRGGVAVTCSSTHLSEVRICLSRDLKFRECQEIDRRACRRERLVMPPVRGG